MATHCPPRVTQRKNIGHTVGVQYGDNINHHHYGADQNSPEQLAQKIHISVKDKKAPGTCEWLLRKHEFQKCVVGKNDTLEEGECSILWIHGSVGCGKSTLMSSAIDYLGEKDGIHLLFYYVGFEDKKEPLWKTMLSTFWSQATRENPPPHPNIFSAKNTVDQFQDDLFELLAKSHRPVYIAVDAFDQLSQEDHNRVFRALQALARRFLSGRSKSRLSIIVSSRDALALEGFEAKQKLEINVRPDDTAHDIKAYLEEKLEKSLLLRAGEPAKTEERSFLIQSALNALERRANGMFLWVRLQAESICEARPAENVQKALSDLILPEQMDKLYKHWVDGSDDSQKEDRLPIAMGTMALLAHTSGFLHEEALYAALGLSAADRSHRRTVPQLCKHLVEFNEKLGSFRFCHASVYEFFQRYKPDESHALVAEICLDHICSSNFEGGPFEGAVWIDTNSLEPFLRDHPFLEFASCNWAKNVNKSPKESRQRLMERFDRLCVGENRRGSDEPESNLHLSFQVCLLSLQNSMANGVRLAHIFSYFGMRGFFSDFKEKGWLDPCATDGEGLTPIHWAINGVSEDTPGVVKYLICHGSDRNAKDNQGRTPLYYACQDRKSSIGVIKCLIREKAGLDLQNKSGKTALIAASLENRCTVVLALIEAGANVAIQSPSGTALRAASSIGCFKCTSKILQRLKQLKAPFAGERDHCGTDTALHAAAFYGHRDIVKLLLDEGFDVREVSRSFGTALTAAAAGMGCTEAKDPTPYVEICQMLIDKGVKVNETKGQYASALWVAAAYGHKELVDLLLNNGAKVRKVSLAGTAYQAAEHGGHQEVMDLLLKRDRKAMEQEGHYSDIFLSPFQSAQMAVLELVLAARSQSRMEALIENAEKIFKLKIEGNNRRNPVPLNVMVRLGERAFDVVVSETIQKEGQRARRQQDYASTADAQDTGDKPTSITKEHPKGSKKLSKLAALISKIKLFLFRIVKQVWGKRTSGVRAQASVPMDTPEGYFPKVLDQLTRAAVSILEHALWCENSEAVAVIAESWTNALQNLVTRAKFGEKMLEKVVGSRTIEFKETLTEKGLSDKERLKKAEGLAKVGVELLITTERRGPKYKLLATILSRIWVSAVNDVEVLGTKYQQYVWSLINTFATKFSDAVEAKDTFNAKLLANSGIEILKEAALSPNKSLVDKFAIVWAREWQNAVGRGMGDLIDQVAERRLEEYETCIDQKKYEEARSLAVAGIRVLRAAIECNFGKVKEKLLDLIKSGFLLTFEKEKVHGAMDKKEGQPKDDAIFLSQEEDIRVGVRSVFDATVDMLITAEKRRCFADLGPLASAILSYIKTDPSVSRKPITDIISQFVQDAQKWHHEEDPQKSQEPKQISAIFYLLDIALSQNLEIPPALKDAALKIWGGVEKRHESSCSKELIMFLVSQEGLS